MSIGEILKTHLEAKGAVFQVRAHSHTAFSMDSAEAAHVPGDRIAKAVVLKDSRGYVMVVVPSVHHIELGTVHRRLGRRLRMVLEEELGTLFPDCEVGAVPPLGDAYGIETVWDDALLGQSDIYFEAGDHEHLVRVTGEQFLRLMGDAQRDRFSHHI